MSKINVVGVNKETFGTKMPNVFLDRISVKYVASEPEDPLPDTEFTAHLSIKFTKPEHIQAGSAREFVREYLDNVYLYAFLTYNNWIKEYLDEDRFSIEYWHKTAIKEHSPAYTEGRFRRIPLSSLIEDENPYSSKLVVMPVFDENGNEVIEITNIKLKMRYSYGGTDGIPLLKDIENLMLFAYTGVKAAGRYGEPGSGFSFTDPADDGLFSERYDDGDYSSGSTTPWTKLSSNTYFSDITYYHILDKNRIATKFFEAYTTSAGIPYYAPILQSTDGNFYATDNYSFDSVRTTLEALIDKHAEDRIGDSVLDSNIKNLEAIINGTENKSGVLLQLSDYRATYPNKSPTVLSGVFYSEFVIAFADIIQAVQAQEQLVVTQLYDSLVVDYRQTLLLGKYNAPNPSGDYPAPHSTRLGIAASDVQKGYPYEMPSDCYIPKKWFLLARKAMLTNTIADYSDDELQELYNARDAVDVSAGAARMSSLRGGTSGLAGGDEESSLYLSFYLELKNRYKSEGFSDSEAARLANEELSYYYSTDEGLTDNSDEPGTVRSELLNPTLNGGSYASLRSGDALVRNQGTFMFDYEKALRTQSMIAHVFDLTKLQQLFRINIPYEHFFVKRVELSRNELRIDRGSWVASKSIRYIRPKLQLIMHDPAIVDPDPGEHIDYPKNKHIDYKYFGGMTESEESDTLAILHHKLKYCRPHYKIGDKHHVSSLKFVNFDMPTSDQAARLKFYNNLDQALDGTLGNLVNERVLDGYRLMAFKFSDAMDDDIAYYNTQNTDDEDRLELLRASNNLDEARTCYSVTVEVEDQTQVSYDNFVEYIRGIYNEFVNYYDFAIETCNFNNITNEFNQFFIDQINAEYPNKIWTKAAYIAHALAELMFSGPRTLDEDLFQENVLTTTLKISPETGNLFQLTAFANELKELINLLTIDSVTSTVSTTLTPSQRMKNMFSYDSAGYGSARLVQFYNEKPIWEPIAGDITPDDIPLSSLTEIIDYAPLPEFVIPAGGAPPIVIPSEIALGDEYSSAWWAMSETLLTSPEAHKIGAIYPDVYYNGDTSIIHTETAVPLGDVVAGFNSLRLFELVFFPWGGIDDPLLDFYDLKGFVERREGAGTGRISDSSFFRRTDMPPRYSYLGGDNTFAAWFLDCLMSYSTMDVRTFEDDGQEKGRLKIGIDPTVQSTRRDGRHAVGCLALVDRLSKVVYENYQSAIDAGAFTVESYTTVLGFFSDQYAKMQRLQADIITSDIALTAAAYEEYEDLLEEYTLSGGYVEGYGTVTEPDPPRDLPTTTEYHIAATFELIYKQAFNTLQHLKTILQTVVREEDINAAGDYKLGRIFNADDPIGPVDKSLFAEGAFFSADYLIGE